ncbi:MAG: YihY/virulence factor BrkB family protein [Opitutales bacterium]|nr:YihY/virulence factor BrkB family protein [Opitutales bacterium]
MTETPSKRRPKVMDPFQRRVRAVARRVKRFWREDIWDQATLEEGSRRSVWFRWMRILAITIDGISGQRLLTRASALSFSSLIGLGPLVATIVIVSGSFLSSDAETEIKRLLVFMAPSIAEYIQIEQQSGAAAVARGGMTEGDEQFRSALDDLIAQIVKGAEAAIAQVNTAGSGFFGLIGVFVLIFIGIQLLTGIETTLNEIWGVRTGRAWGNRIVSYWTFISLGAVLGIGSAALLSASAIAGFFEIVPFFGDTLTGLFILISPLLGFGMITLLLTAFYMYFPNAVVKVKPALIGAVVVAALLFLNNYLSILYVGQVIRFQSLYGSVGIIPVLMIGLFFFWVFVLLGGQISYAIQNVDYLSHREAWESVSVRAQETLTLGVLLCVCRDFAECRPPPSFGDLSSRLRVPGNVLNESLSLLLESGWVAPTPVVQADQSDEICYRPAIPLKRMTLAGYHHLFENFGNSTGIEAIEGLDPLIAYFHEQVGHGVSKTLADAPFDELFESRPVDRAPGALA